jgi:hypothetical protein
MFVNVTVTAKGGATGRGLVELDYKTNRYTIEPLVGWGSIGFSVFGSFTISPGELVLSDQNTPQFGNKLVLQAGPLGESDAVRTSGTGTVESPLGPRFEGATLDWTTGSPLRARILEIVDKDAGLPHWPGTKANFPSGPPSQATKDQVAKVRKEKGLPPIPPSTKKPTNCGEFPGWVARRIGGTVAGDLFKIFDSPNGALALTAPMTAWDQYAKAIEGYRKSPTRIWRAFGAGCGRPLPGDVYILGSAPGGQFAHVGIVYDSSTTTWVTADCGQKGGFQGSKRKRLYDPTSGMLTSTGGGDGPDEGTKWLLGWINIDALIPDWQPSAPKAP